MASEWNQSGHILLTSGFGRPQLCSPPLPTQVIGLAILRWTCCLGSSPRLCNTSSLAMAPIYLMLFVCFLVWVRYCLSFQKHLAGKNGQAEARTQEEPTPGPLKSSLSLGECGDGYPTRPRQLDARSGLPSESRMKLSTKVILLAAASTLPETCVDRAAADT